MFSAPVVLTMLFVLIVAALVLAVGYGVRREGSSSDGSGPAFIPVPMRDTADPASRN